MDLASLQPIIEYRYAILIPLSFVEGPIVAFFAGTLASLGYFNVFALAGFFFARDIIVDLLCYALGYYGGQTGVVKKLLSKIGVTPGHLEHVRKLWFDHTGKTMFLSKLSYGVAASFIVVAGMVRLPVKKFVTYGSAVAVMHYGVLLVIGYFFGTSFGGTITHILENIPLMLLVLSVIAILYFVFKSYISKELVKTEKEAGQEPPTHRSSPTGSQSSEE